MIFTGMIFQYNSDQGVGLIMLSDGEKKDFTIAQWIDKSNAPAVGLKISYDDGYIKKVKLFTEEETNNTSLDANTDNDPATFTSIQEYKKYYSDQDYVTNSSTSKKLTMQKYSTEGIHSIMVSLENSKPEVTKDLFPLTSVDDHVQYFKDMGYKLASDSGNGELREVSLRSYSADDYGEVKINYKNFKVNVTVMMNGKKVY